MQLYDYCGYKGECDARDPAQGCQGNLICSRYAAVRGTPAVITRHGRKEAVVLSFEDYERLSHVPTFGQFLTSFPGDEGDIPERNRSPARDVDL